MAKLRVSVRGKSYETWQSHRAACDQTPMNLRRPWPTFLGGFTSSASKNRKRRAERLDTNQKVWPFPDIWRLGPEQIRPPLSYEHAASDTSSTLGSTCASCACGPVAPGPRGSALPGRKPSPIRARTPRSSPPCPAARSSASPRWLPAWSHRSPPAGPAAVHHPPTSSVPSRTLRDACPHRSAAACAISSSGPACTRPARCPQTVAAPASPPTARRSHARCRCPRNTRSAVTGSRSPASATAARTWPHRTSRPALRQIRRSAPPPATRLAAGRTDVPELTPTRCAQSRCPLASPVACAGPLPCPHSTYQACGSLIYFVQVSRLSPRAASDQGTANLVTAKLISYLTKYGVPVVESGTLVQIKAAVLSR